MEEGKRKEGREGRLLDVLGCRLEEDRVGASQSGDEKKNSECKRREWTIKWTRA